MKLTQLTQLTHSEHKAVHITADHAAKSQGHLAQELHHRARRRLGGQREQADALGELGVVFFLPRDFNGSAALETGTGLVPVLSRAMLLFVVLPYLALLIMSGTYSPFLYFQF